MTKTDKAPPAPEEIASTYLAFRWSVSRGRETYGYNIMTVTDQETGKSYRCNGGGYDMTGTSFGLWLEDRYQGRLLQVAVKRAAATWSKAEGFTSHRDDPDHLYGLTLDIDEDGTPLRATVDGACGFESMRGIAEVMGLKFERTYVPRGPRRGDTTGYIVSAA